MLLDLLNGASSDRGDRLALDSLTYAQLHERALRVAAKLRERGVGAGDRVAIYSQNRHGFVYSYLASLYMGAIAVPVNVLYRSSDLAHVLGDCRPSAVVTSRAIGASNEIDVADVERWANDESVAPFEPRRLPDPEDIALIVYTSGTTGAAKGAMLSHRNLAAIASQLIAAWRWQRDDVLLVVLPLFHVHGLIAALTTSLCAGSAILLRERFDASDVLQTLGAGGITMFFGVPTMYVRLLENAGDANLPALRLYVCGSAALSAETHDAFRQRFGASILERYGATEFGFALSNRYAGPRVPGSVGIPLPGVRVQIDGSEEVGELLVSGPNVFAGYWRLPDATQAAFSIGDDGTRWYRSGDLASYDAERNVYTIVGRIKELIISGGFNVYPREVEDAIEAMPGVCACAVIGKPDPARGELPVAFVEAEASFDPDAMIVELRERLASFKVPKEVRVIDQLPRNAMGKLDKPALRNLL